MPTTCRCRRHRPLNIPAPAIALPPAAVVVATAVVVDAVLVRLALGCSGGGCGDTGGGGGGDDGGGYDGRTGAGAATPREVTKAGSHKNGNPHFWTLQEGSLHLGILFWLLHPIRLVLLVLVHGVMWGPRNTVMLRISKKMHALNVAKHCCCNIILPFIKWLQ